MRRVAIRSPTPSRSPAAVVTAPAATGLAGGEALVADRGVEGGDLLAGVRDDRSVDVGEGGEAFDLGGVDEDQPTRVQRVEDLAGALPGAHQQRQVGVLGVGEPVHGLQLEAGLGACPAGGVVEHAAAADGGELVPVTDERDPGAWSRRRW